MDRPADRAILPSRNSKEWHLITASKEQLILLDCLTPENIEEEIVESLKRDWQRLLEDLRLLET